MKEVNEECATHRYFDSIRFQDKKWFFSSLEAIINNVETIGKKK